jgi:phosphopantothenoylcysteine decarboxylase/phosphopantothenate--cysteine ligase
VSAAEMYDACHNYFSRVDVAICAAAVADYRPQNASNHKIKKTAAELTLSLEQTQDILASLGANKTHQVLVGFALETENEIQNAIAKIQKKNLDLIVLNSLQDEGAGFGKDTNKVTIIDQLTQCTSLPLQSKEAVAAHLINLLIEKYYA